MPSIEPEELPRRRSRGELLDHIYAQGARRRRRRQIGSVGLSAAALAVVAGAVLAINLPGGTPQHVATRGQTAPPFPGSTTPLPVFPTTTVVAAPAPPTTVVVTSVPPTTARSTVVGGSGTVPTTTIRTPTTATDREPEPTTTTVAPPTTIATSSCRNSSDAACGPFRWDPEPGPNAPLVIDVTPAPRAADPLTYDFAVVYTDADAPIADGCRTVNFGDGQSSFTGSTGGCAVASCIAAFGAWTPPTPQAGRAEGTVAHTFPRSGTYEVTLYATSRNSFCHDPYTSTATKTVTVVVP